jgi:tRNA dimethylallyltransferase
MMRFTEVCIGSGKLTLLSSTRKNSRQLLLSSSALKPKEASCDRINQRVDIMMKEGLLAEAKHLYPNKDMNALQTVGYRIVQLFRRGCIAICNRRNQEKHKAFCQATTHLVQA